MKEILKYENRKSEPYYWDASTKENKIKAYKSLFKVLEEWNCFTFISPEELSKVEAEIVPLEALKFELDGGRVSPLLLQEAQTKVQPLDRLRKKAAGLKDDIRLLEKARSGNAQAVKDLLWDGDIYGKVETIYVDAFEEYEEESVS